MIHALTNLSPVTILVVAILGFGLGAIWYSPLLFVKAWMEETKITPETWKATPGRGPKLMAGSFLPTVVSTVTLATLIAALHVYGAAKGAEFGLLAWAGLVAARQGGNALFELRSLRHSLIVSGHDVVLFAIQGAILGVWR